MQSLSVHLIEFPKHGPSNRIAETVQIFYTCVIYPFGFDLYVYMKFGFFECSVIRLRTDKDEFQIFARKKKSSFKWMYVLKNLICDFPDLEPSGAGLSNLNFYISETIGEVSASISSNFTNLILRKYLILGLVSNYMY